VFGTLVRRYQRELYGYLRRYLGDPHLADDVFQTTFVQVFSKAAQYEPGRPVRPWLYAIATNQAIDAMRRAGRHPAVSLEQTETEAEGERRGLIDLLEARATRSTTSTRPRRGRWSGRASPGCRTSSGRCC
jgi:RNA polymerase sigma-70 factor (ECF subfamily)